MDASASARHSIGEIRKILHPLIKGGLADTTPNPLPSPPLRIITDDITSLRAQSDSILLYLLVHVIVVTFADYVHGNFSLVETVNDTVFTEICAIKTLESF